MSCSACCCTHSASVVQDYTTFWTQLNSSTLKLDSSGNSAAGVSNLLSDWVIGCADCVYWLSAQTVCSVVCLTSDSLEASLKATNLFSSQVFSSSSLLSISLLSLSACCWHHTHTKPYLLIMVNFLSPACVDILSSKMLEFGDTTE